MLPMWVIVADRSVCRIFARDAPGAPLRELEVLAHPEGRLREQDLVSDLPGRTFDSHGSGRHAKEVPVSPKKHEAMVFAKRIAERLEAGRVAEQFESLALIRRKLGMKLGKFAGSIERVSVRVTDVNGPRGGVDTACSVKVVLSRLPSTVVEQRDRELRAAIDGALGRAERAVRRAIMRRRGASSPRRRG